MNTQHNCISTICSFALIFFSLFFKDSFAYISRNIGFNDLSACNTKGCIQAANIILNDMDPAQNPCDNFYKFVCGGYILKNSIPEHDHRYNTFSNITEIITHQLKQIVEEDKKPYEIEPFKMVKQLYRDCMKEDFVTSHSLKAIQKKIQEIGDWPITEEQWNKTDESWISIVQKSREIGFLSNYILTLYTSPDLKNSSINLIHIDTPYLRSKPEITRHMKPDYKLNTYFRLMVDIGLKFQKPLPMTLKELSPVLSFEAELAKIYPPIPKTKAERINSSITTTINEAQRSYPFIPWLKLIQAMVGSVNVSGEETIVISYPEFTVKLQALLGHTSNRVLANYILWRNIQESLHIYYINSFQAKWKNCLSTVEQRMEAALNAMYIRRYYQNVWIKKNIVEMVNAIKTQLYQTIVDSDWMDENTRKTALHKAEAITERLVYAEELFDNNKLIEYYKNISLITGNYYENVLKISKFQLDYAFLDYKTPNNKSSWLSYRYPFAANAFNVYEENSIEIPAALLQGKFYSADRPNYLNYGAIGFIISHELSHTFDSNGRYYDKNGNYENWWKNETEKKYFEKVKCFVDQYNEYVVEEIGEKVDGTSTLGENISDNEGVRIAYKAYKAWIKKYGSERKLPGLSYTPEQLFWISTANSWCSKHTFLYMIENTYKDTHAPSEIRILGAFSNQKEFAKDFECPLGSKMNPVKKCTIW